MGTHRDASSRPEAAFRSGTSLRSGGFSLLVSALLVLVGAAGVEANPAAGPSDDESTEARADSTVTVELLNYDYGPNPIRIRPGDTLRLVNATNMPHNAVFGEIPDGAQLESREIGPYLTGKGDAYEMVIDDRFVAGTYEIYCTPHKALGMTGKIIVEGSSSPAAGEGGGSE